LTGTFLAVNEALEVVGEHQLRCRPSRWDKDAEEAYYIHRISRDQAYQFPPFWDSMKGLFSWFKKYEMKYFVCHSKRDMFGKMTTFDHSVIRMNLFPSDAYHVFVNQFRERNIISTHSLAKFTGLQAERLDLKSICKHLGIELTNHHDARHDAYACYYVFKRLINNVDLSEFINWDYYKIREVQNGKSKRTKPKNSKEPFRLQGDSIFN
jgi:DNA polymerase III epsilon subunit-like protein